MLFLECQPQLRPTLPHTLTSFVYGPYCQGQEFSFGSNLWQFLTLTMVDQMVTLNRVAVRPTWFFSFLSSPSHQLKLAQL